MTGQMASRIQNGFLDGTGHGSLNRSSNFSYLIFVFGSSPLLQMRTTKHLTKQSSYPQVSVIFDLGSIKMCVYRTPSATPTERAF
jgi:hypothetical protein